ncbi:MAG: YqeG family HAD IIIA-type phosphatase [Eubacterium sp.]|nr:YqeG family HAD IIIA-type phosphatase [Eubacterium sp.]
MTNFLFPTEYYASTYSIDFEKYYNHGYRAIIFDIDNTLVPHDAMHDDRSRKLFKRLSELGFKIAFVSNNNKARVEEFNKEVGGYIIYKAGKPHSSGFINAMKHMGSTRENTLFIGDQLFTDIWGANNAHLHSILVKPIDKKEEIQIVLKRYLEYPILKLYLRKHRLKGC